MGSMRDDYHRTRPTDVQDALRQGAEQIWAGLDDNSQLLRVMFHEPEAIDELWSADAGKKVGQPRRLANRQRAW